MSVCSDMSTNIRVGRSDILFFVSYFFKEGMAKLIFQLILLILHKKTVQKVWIMGYFLVYLS